MRISDHFPLHELTRSSNADRRGIQNIPGEAEIQNLIILCAGILEPVRKHFKRGFIPGSVYRNPEVNALAGSGPTSQHLQGQAADIEIAGIDNFDLALWISGNLLFDQLILEHYTKGQPSSGWVHISLKQTGNREEVLSAVGKKYLPGLRS